MKLFLLHFVGNGLLLWLGYYWLGIGESDGAHLAWSALVLLFFICSVLWLHGTAFARFRPDANLSLAQAAGRAARNLAPLFVLGIAALIIYALLAWWHDSFGHVAFVAGSYATMRLRKPVPPTSVERGFHVFIWILRWLVVPVLLLPLASAIAIRGWDAWRWSALRPGRRVVYWIEVCALLVVAIWVPLKLVAWVPAAVGFNTQMISFLARLGAGYLLFVCALLAVEFLTSSGRPRLTQPSTAVSP
jgi:hypothetical protein